MGVKVGTLTEAQRNTTRKGERLHLLRFSAPLLVSAPPPSLLRPCSVIFRDLRYVFLYDHTKILLNDHRETS